MADRSPTDPEVPTKTVVAPDGSLVHFPDLPNLGESYRAPSIESGPVATRDAQASFSPSPQAPPPSSESWRERVANAARSAAERAGALGHAALDALVLDDWKALTNAQSTPLQRLGAAADLASWAIPEGKIAEIAGHAIAKAGEVAAARMTAHAAEQAAEHAVAAGVERTAPAVAAAGVARWSKSDILTRPLTEAERGGAFTTADDLKTMLGRAGDGKDWHHIVESHTEARFGSGRVQNVENVVAIQRDPTHRDISRTFQINDRRLGPGPDGKDQNLRTFLKDRPLADHVRAGEDQLRQRGIDPDLGRAETRERFEQRLEAHDRRMAARSNEPPGPPAPLAGASRAELHVARDGATHAVRDGQHFMGWIERIEGDAIVQDFGRGHTVTWSREELGRHFDDPKALDAAMQPGNMVDVGVGRDGAVDVQRHVAGRGWESLGQQSLPQWQQIESPTVTPGVGR